MKIAEMEDGMIIFDEGDIFSKDNALVILYAENESDGYQFISKVLEELYPNYKTLGQSIIEDGDKVYDVIKISYSGHALEVWFNITEFYGIK